MLSRIVDYSVFLVLGLVFLVWGQEIDWRLDKIDALELFPLLGLIAFTTMWWHFFSGHMRRINPELERHKGLHTTSAYWVFASFMLHPLLLLFWGIEKEVGDWPGEIYEKYVGDDQMIFIYMGLLGLGGFLLFDIARVFRSISIFEKNRKLITAISDVSFLLILIHSLNLGRHLQEGWFRYYWILLGLSGLYFIGYRYYQQRYEAST